MSGQISFQVKLLVKVTKFHFCGGSALYGNYVLTAAHCVNDKNATDIIVIAGDIINKKRIFSHEIEKVIIHKEFNRDGHWENDIAVLKLKMYFELTPWIKKIRLPNVNDSYNPSSTFVISGWGGNHGQLSMINTFQQAELLIADQSYCEQVYGMFGINISDKNLCAFDPQSPRGPCHGDDGGPLSSDTAVVGILSFVVSCVEYKYPAIFTRVLSYLDWIDENTTDGRLY
ncbi:chymotrypsin-2-like isoform X2 [Prorops nasuta]